MIDKLTPILPFTQEYLWLGFLAFLRVGSAFVVLPGFGEQMIPLRVRLAGAVCFAVIILPIIAPDLRGAPSGAPVALGVSEISVGLMIGIFLRFFIHALQIAGTIAAQAVSLSQLLGPMGADPVPALGQVLVLGGVTLALVLGLHVQAAEYFVLSYDLLPPGHPPEADLFSRFGTDLIARIFALAFTLAAPFLVASLIYNLALGAINRAMPQLMVAFVGAPAITAGGLVLLVVSAPLILGVWADVFFDFMSNPGF